MTQISFSSFRLVLFNGFLCLSLSTWSVITQNIFYYCEKNMLDSSSLYFSFLRSYVIKAIDGRFAYIWFFQNHLFLPWQMRRAWYLWSKNVLQPTSKYDLETLYFSLSIFFALAWAALNYLPVGVTSEIKWPYLFSQCLPGQDGTTDGRAVKISVKKEAI